MRRVAAVLLALAALQCVAQPVTPPERGSMNPIVERVSRSG